MSSDVRKITDVIVSLENKVNILLGMVRAQDLTIKLISNKLNELISLGHVQAHAQTPTKIQGSISVESVDTKIIPIIAENNLPVAQEPDGFRRTSRPESYVVENKTPIQVPTVSGQAEIIVPSENNKQEPLPNHPMEGNTIPVSQRVVDSNSKSIFLADVEIINAATLQQVYKTRTNGAGKWSAPLTPGDYRIFIRKRESLSKDKLEATQNIKVDGSNSPYELPLMIIKK
jgi:hypothetical protein